MDYKGTKVISLVRVSTQEQAEDDRAGIPAQQESVGRIIARYELDCIDTVVLTNVSGTATFQCPDILRLLQRLASNEVSGLVITRMDRLLRPDKYGDFALLGAIQSSGALIFDETGVIDLSSDQGFLSAGFNALFAGQEIRTFKRRVAAGKEVKRRKGECPNSHITLPLGVGYNRKLQQWYYKDGIEKVETAFRLLDEKKCESLASVAESIGMTPRGVAHILRNKIYIGFKEYAWKRGEKYPSKDGRQSDRKKVRRTPKEIISIQVIPVPAIDPARFERVQKILDTVNSLWRVSRSGGRPHLGSSILVCSRCGRNLNCKPGKGDKGGYYVCASNDCYWRSKGCSCEQPTIPERIIDKALVDFLSEKLSDRHCILEIVRHYLDSQRCNAQASKVSSEVTNATIKRLEGRLSRMEELYLDGGFASSKEYLFKRKQAEDELKTLREQTAPAKETTPESFEPMIRRLITGALAVRRSRDRKVQQSVIRGLIASITICDAQIMGFSLKPPVDALFGEKDTRTDTDSSPPPA